MHEHLLISNCHTVCHTTMWRSDLVFLSFFVKNSQKLRNRQNIVQGCRSWQPFGEGKNGHTNFRQARSYYFRDKCIVFANLLMLLSIIWNIYHVIVYFLPRKHCFWPKRCLFAQRIPKINFHLSPNFSAKALRVFAQLLPPWCSQNPVKM